MLGSRINVRMRGRSLWRRLRRQDSASQDGTCPPEATLLARVEGRLGVEETDSLEGHLSLCRQCLDTFLELRELQGLTHLRPSQPGSKLAAAARVAGAAACALAVAFLGFELGRTTRSERADLLEAVRAAVLLEESGDGLGVPLFNDGLAVPAAEGRGTDGRPGVVGDREMRP